MFIIRIVIIKLIKNYPSFQIDYKVKVILNLDIIGERDFKIIESLKRQDLIELTRFAEFLMFEDLVDLLMTVILFHLAGT